jgi:hypothetical protein
LPEGRALCESEQTAPAGARIVPSPGTAFAAARAQPRVHRTIMDTEIDPTEIKGLRRRDRRQVAALK